MFFWEEDAERIKRIEEQVAHITQTFYFMQNKLTTIEHQCQLTQIATRSMVDSVNEGLDRGKEEVKEVKEVKAVLDNPLSDKIKKKIGRPKKVKE